MNFTIKPETVNYVGSSTKLMITTWKMSVQLKASLVGFETMPSVVLSLKCVPWPVRTSGQHCMAIEKMQREKRKRKM